KPWKQLANISKILADFLGSISYSSAISLAKGPAINIEIVLLAVEISAALTSPAIPNSAPRFDLTLLRTKFNNQVIPPLCCINATSPPINSAIIAISSIPTIPFEIELSKPDQLNDPSTSPIIADNTVPPINTKITLMPASAKINTNKYGITLIKLKSYDFVVSI